MSPWWIAAAVTIAWVAGGAACADRPMLTDDQLCELYIGQQLHEITDLWNIRYSINVLCHAEQPVGSQLVVTVAPANDEEPISSEVALRIEQRLRASVEGIVESNEWQDRYPRRLVQVIP